MLHKHYMRAHVWLRVLIFGFTLAAAVCMGLNKQTSLVAGYQFEASYKSSPTFKIFVIGNSITCGCTLFSVFFITNLVEGYLFHLFDLVLMGLVMASAASTTAIAYVGKKGNGNIGWNMAMKSYIWLQTVEGSIQQVEEEVAMSYPMICREVLQTGMGSSKIVNPAVLGLILDYCRFHQVPGRSNKERKSFDEKFIKTDVDQLCELASAADSLQLRPLDDITSRALAHIIEGKTPEEIWETFHLPDDLTEGGRS